MTLVVLGPCNVEIIMGVDLEYSTCFSERITLAGNMYPDLKVNHKVKRIRVVKYPFNGCQAPSINQISRPLHSHTPAAAHLYINLARGELVSQKKEYISR